ncbi:MAG: putative transporter (permease and ATP-binding protein) [Acidobacteria bacterium]|nr:putative transporter (permease and ATP-binding protein) [Acidobacteriota bacterium]
MRALLRILHYLRSHLGWVAVAVAGMIGVALAVVVLIALIQPVFDEVLGGQVRMPGVGSDAGAKAARLGDSGFVGSVRRRLDGARAAVKSWLPSDVGAILLLGVLTLFVKNALIYLGHYAFYRAGLATVKDLRDDLMERLLGQSARYFQERPSAVLMSRVTNDVEQITAAVSDRLSDLFQDSFTVVAVMIYLFSLNLRLSLAAFVAAPLLLWPIVHFAGRLRRRSWQSQERLGEMNTVVDEVLKGFRVVQAFGMEAFEGRRFRAATLRHFRANLRARKIVALNAPVVEILGAAGMALLFFYANRMIAAGAMTLGSFSSFLFGLYALYAPVKRLTKVNLVLQAAAASAERVFEVIDAPVEVAERPGAQPLAPLRQAIRFEAVGFAYEPDKPVLRGFSLEVPAGRAVALVGPSGAGKSTVAQLLPRFWDVDEGRITVDGVDIRDVTLRSLRGQLGLVTQETVLFNTTIRANIAYGRDEVDDVRLHACARAAFAEEFIAEFPDGFDTVVGEAGVRLSGGQRQRLAVARALYKDPPILILDEATSALDAESEAVVQRALENLMQGRTTLVIAHRLATVRSADLIAVIDGGRVVEQGSHAELLARRGMYARLAELQGIRE